MPHIKKLVMHGFKSFARKTEIIFEEGMNSIVGPNGSGKSNITDALCFVLGRLSIKSIRAAKAANLLFSGNKNYKASNEASVELIFDNADKTFGIDANEILIKRIVRRNGQSIYKINNETKTRQELLELLAQAGIDPNGFNIVLQGEIASFVKMNSEERRRVIEEVAGISIYETRKHKSILELEKSDEKLKEVSAVLRERGNYLKQLERDRQEALNFQKLDEIIKKCKATILDRNIKEKQKDIWGLDKTIENYEKEIQKIKSKIKSKEEEISALQEKITQINKLIQSSTSDEQEVLHKELSDLKADLAGLEVRKENHQSRIQEAREKEVDYKERIKELEKKILEMQSSSPEIKKQQEQLTSEQNKFDILERQRRKFYLLKSELSTLENRKNEKSKTLIESKKESELIEKQISVLFEEIKFAKSLEQAVKLKQQIKQDIEKIKQDISESSLKILESEKTNAVLEKEIEREERLKKDIIQLDICPLCKSKVTKEHIQEVLQVSDKKINYAKKTINENQDKKADSKNKINALEEKLFQFQSKLNIIDIDSIKIKNAEDRKQQLIRLSSIQKESQEELKDAESRLLVLKKEFETLKNVEEKYDEARLRLQELSYADVDVDTEITIKQRELNRLKTDLKSIIRDIESSSEELKQINEQFEKNYKIINKKEKQEQELYERFQKYFNDRNEFQDKQKTIETDIIGLQHEIRSFEEKINMQKIQKAQINAQADSLKTELKEFEKFSLLEGKIEEIKERLQKAQLRLSQIGNVNMRALEIYDTVLQQCSAIQEKTDTIAKEKEKIMNIIAEIDKKKKKSFIKTLEAVNEYFNRNFTQLSKKGEVLLELENPQDPFAAGLNILLKVARGKYFDVTSLSGGEKTIVALSLIFAIQEYKPYCFYIFDEIDAALDKHNSERLAALIKRYMVSGQYIVVTHNDALISEASALYGVSMQENMSKVISLKI